MLTLRSQGTRTTAAGAIAAATTKATSGVLAARTPATATERGGFSPSIFHVGQYVNLPYGEDGDCVEYTQCGSPTRHCLYGPETGHQIPPYYAAASWEYFRSF